MQAFHIEHDYARGYAVTGFAPSIFTIPGHPFTAQRTYTEWRRDGGPDQPVVTTTVTIARDSVGRIHYESSRQRGEVDVMITDPVAHFSYRYWIKRKPVPNPEAEQCRTQLMSEISHRGALDLPPASVVLAAYAPGQTRYPQVKDQKRPLGTQDMDGVLAFGQESVHVVSNQFGVKQMVIEQWFAPDLGLNMLEIHEIEGQNSFSTRTHDLAYAEPDPMLFEVPANYALPAKIHGCNERH